MIYVIFIVIILLAMSLKVVKEYDRGVVFFLGKLRGELPEPANVDWGGIQACAPFALDHLTSSALASLDLRADHDAPDYS